VRAQVLTLTACFTALSSGVAQGTQDRSPGGWTEEFNLGDRRLTDVGESAYFILKPGFTTVLESRKARLTITVLDETKEINGIVTRVVEEREEKKGKLFEVSRNFYAMDQATGDVFYFGEEVDFYKRGKVTGHSGAWMAYENRNRPGLIMPGSPRVGMKYYQELAPGIAMDRAEVISTTATFRTPAGELSNCLRTRESSKIKVLLFITPREYKTYAPGIGLVQDGDMTLVSYGYTSSSGER
jgi:hypothetical protein